MIHLFRNIRRRFFSENPPAQTPRAGRVGRYLLYAIGEILLVVIGILIALQVDNWNEERRLKDQEYALLGDLKSDLQETLNDLMFGISLNESTIDNYRILLKAIDNNEPHSGKIDSASVHINFFYVPRFRRTTYESLKSRGEILSNDTLKRAISNVYDRTFTYLTEDQLKIEWAMYNEQSQHYNTKYLRYKDQPAPVAFPVDFEKMKSDTAFINYLSTLIVIRSYGVTVFDDTIEEIQKVLSAIEREMENLKK